ATGSDTCGSVTISQSDVETAACGNTKTIIRTWTATDACGNATSADQTITVTDTTPPTISAPADVTIECTEDESSANTGVATGSDTCGTVTITQTDDVTTACGNTKTIIRTWTATDACGNATSADQTITVQDTTPPTITAPADVTIECTEDESSANTGVATGIDTCGDVIILQSDVETEACGNTKTIVRTWTATDACGNATSADQTITVTDTTPPTISAPADVTIECTEDESSANTGVATGSDTCGTVTISQSDLETLACGNTKTITRTWTATDDCGNATSADQTIIVQDTTPPTISAPADVTIECTEDESSANTGVATGNDTCGSVTISQSDVETAACGNTKTIIRTWTATDACGNATSADQTITVQDTTPPTIDNSGIQNIDIQCGVTPDGTLEAWLLNNAGATASDTCGNVTWSNDYGSNTAVDCANGAITVTFTATDDCNNASSTTATYSIIDTVDPILTIPADITIECTEDTNPANTGTATATDDCAAPNVSFSDSEIETCGNTKTITRTWTATDACGNATSADQTITVTDTTPPTISAPADVTIECTEDESSANTGVATGSDTCGDVIMSQSDVETEACGNTKTIIRTWTATDACGNATSADQTITVQDTTPPTISAPADVTIECTEDETSANTGVATGSDTCSSVTISQSDVETAACGNTKTIIRTWTATDDCGNATSADQTITVQDTTPPTITAPADVTIECTEDESSANTGVATGSDTCGTVTISQSDVETAACGNTKTIIRTWTATDTCGNATSADQTITVQDTTPPTISAPADVTIECTEDETSANTGVATGSDTCSSVTISQSDVETAACGNTKTIIRTWTATDDCGNATSADQTITVQDTTPPTITAPADVTIECTEDESSANTGVATGSDTCGTVTISQSDVETAACGNTKTIIRTWTATDTCGNATSADQTITVQDTTPPTISAPADVTIECTEDESSANTGMATGSDTCGTVTISQSDVETAACGNTKTIIRTWTATDACGNATSADQTITVQDTTPPTISAPADVTIECTEDESSANTGVATGNDTCGSVTISQSDVETAACGNTKTIIRTWTATDDCGNATSADQTITVQDTTPPTFTVPADITIECDIDENNLTITGDVIDENDSCDTDLEATYSDTVAVGSCANESIITRTWSLADTCNNTTTLIQTISVVDTTPPTFTAPANLNLECDVDVNDLTITGDVIDEADNCSIGLEAIYKDIITDGNCPGSYIINRKWTLVDSCDNISTALQTIRIEDNTTPTFTVPTDLTIECDVDATDLTITGDVTDETDNCSTGLEATYSDIVAAGNCANESVITRTWSLTDECDNTTTLVQTINVVDTTAPTFTVPADLTVECDVDSTNLTITGDVTDETDNCATGLEATYSDIVAAGNCTNEYVITRTWSLTDECDNATTLVQTINVVDTTAPTFTVPVDLTIECDVDATDLTITGNVTDETDNCSTGLEATFLDTTVEGSCRDSYTIQRTWTLEDDCDNTTTLVQTITIQDTTAPTFTIPADITVECDVDVTNLAITGDVTDEADNCDSGIEATFTDSETAGSCANESIITRTWSLTDDCDNTTVLIQTITIQDSTPPTFDVDLPSDVTLECDAVPATETITATDNCGDATVTVVESTTAGSCDNEYTLVRTWTAADDCGNETIHTQTITVQDTTAPSFNETLPADMDAECDAVPVAETLTATDSCSTTNVTVEEEITNGACIGDYIIERTWTTTDNCGNDAIHIQIITVRDNTAPTLVTAFDENITVACDSIPSIPDLVFEDSCSNDIDVVFNEASTQINDFEDYSIIRTWIVTDDCGNESQFVQNITVEISNVINVSDANRCILDIEFDLFDLLSGDFDMDGTWTVVAGNASLNGSFFDPASVDEIGIYTFMYSITEGPCPTEVEVNVTIDDDCVVLACGKDNVVISKTVTANGDNYNEYFTITGVEVCGFVVELQIFNRWGAEIYKNNNYQNDWNGDAHGSSVGSSGKVPTGTYYYIINLRNSGLEPFAGPIYVATK
ncbi:gliding motility-associated C-terminal domain-containing protein, partial [Winogradskyella sp.]|uniref:HYR-like domain-containing protein n=1 Tax=Winogradskyella sp. TaxID=1883156 RepID=UPI0025E18A84